MCLYLYSGRAPVVDPRPFPRHGLKRRLEASVACQGQECSSPPVRVVQVGEGFYAFVPPTCVHFFFANGKIVTTSRLGHRIGRGDRQMTLSLCAGRHASVSAARL